MHLIGAMLFDLDGTLVDSVSAHTTTWMRALRVCGVDLTYDAVHDQIGKGSDQLVPDLVGDEVAARCGETAIRLHDRIYTRECLPRLRVFPSVNPLFATLRQQGCRIAVVSSARRAELDRLVSQIAGPIDVVVCGEDVPRTKPDPALWRVALHRLNLPANQALAVGDSPYDFEAAKALGLKGIGVLTGGFSEERLRRAGARQVYEDIDDLHRHLGDWLPLPKVA
jgi:HAD superfamily hydrolase (TIGR01509 family)